MVLLPRSGSFASNITSSPMGSGVCPKNQRNNHGDRKDLTDAELHTLKKDLIGNMFGFMAWWNDEPPLETTSFTVDDNIMYD